MLLFCSCHPAFLTKPYFYYVTLILHIGTYWYILVHLAGCALLTTPVRLFCADVDIVLGLNGLIWVGPHIPRNEDGSLPDQIPQTTPAQRQAVCRVANAIKALEKLYLQIYPASIMNAYAVTLQNGISVKDMLEGRSIVMIVQSEAVRRRDAVQ